MQVLDDVVCNNDLFGAHKGEKHSTESLDSAFRESTYEITPSGRLELLVCTYEDQSDPNAQGWERLIGCSTPVFTGERRDMNLHGWVDFPGFGRAKFTDGTMKAFMPASSQSGPAPASEGSFDMQSGGIAEYLRRFFTELEQLKHRKSYYVSHAISFRDGRLFVLISRGDCRERVYVEALDENPLNAAQQVVQLWQAKIHKDEDIE